MPVLQKLKQEIYLNYKTLRESPFLHVEVYSGIIVLNWSPRNGPHIPYGRVQQMKNFMLKYLKEHKQTGYFYVGPYFYQVK